MGGAEYQGVASAHREIPSETDGERKQHTTPRDVRVGIWKDRGAMTITEERRSEEQVTVTDQRGARPSPGRAPVAKPD